MPFVADTSYAPQLLVFRNVTEWPSISEQVATYGRLTGEGFLNVNTFALLDFRKAVVNAALKSVDLHGVTAGGPRRRAYIVSTDEQRQFIAAMQQRAPRGFHLQSFLHEREAIAWLFPTSQPFPVSFMDQE